MNPLRLLRHHNHQHQDHRLPDQIFDNLKQAALADHKKILKIYQSKLSGLEKNEVNKRLKKYGPNETIGQRPKPIWLKLILSFKDPLIILLLILAALSLTTGSISSVAMILSMVFLSVFIKFWQETKAQTAALSLEKIVKVSTIVLREREQKKVSLKKIVPGDIVLLSAGDMVPADLRLLECQGLLVDQSMFTGESLPIEKSFLIEKNKQNPLYFNNLCFMGTSIDSGFAKGVVIATGPSSYFGSMVKNILAERELTNFDLWLKSFTQLIMRLVIVMVVLVFIINFLTKGDIWQAFLFSLAVTVGLAPEMLPMIVSANLASGALRLAKKKVIVKHLSSIQNLGSMDILCTDKTGTLTLNQIILEKHCDINHQDSPRVLRQAYINSYHQTGFKNILDQAILNYSNITLSHIKKIGEIPFDFQRKMLSIVYQEGNKKTLVVKGAAEEIFKRCDYYELNGQTHKVNKDIFPRLEKEFTKLSWDGFRVLGLAYKNVSTSVKKYSPLDEKNLTFLGYLAFLDPPKPSAKETIEKLNSLGIDIKILTGDNQIITQKICQEVSFKIKGLITGEQIDKADAKNLSSLVEKNNIFTQLSPLHKEKIITALRHNRHVVGYLGDGINDAPALRAGDVGISVDSGTNIAKESSDIILLEKNLLVLGDGVMEGRRIFANIIKYIRMATSSNFGNMASVIGTSIFLPFLPMLPIQILLNNLLYDISQSTIPTDQVDQNQLEKITTWDIKKVKKYILSFGIVSSIFDYATFLLLLWAFNAWYNPALFQTGWFIESLLSQTLIIHVIRTNKIPFVQSRASWPLIASTIIISLIGIYLPFSPLASNLGFVIPPPTYWLGLGIIIVLYLTTTQILKNYFQKKAFI